MEACTCSRPRSFSPSSAVLNLFTQLLKHEGRVQKRTRNKAKKTPQPTRLGPISLSSRVLNPFSPRPTKVMTRPTEIIPSPM